MALTERSRSAIYQGLSGLIRDEEAVGEMLSYFPARDVEEPASKELVRTESALLRADMAVLRADMHAEIGSLRAEMHAEIGSLRAEMHAESKRIIMWTVASNATVVGVVLAVTGLA